MYQRVHNEKVKFLPPSSPDNPNLKKTSISSILYSLFKVVYANTCTYMLIQLLCKEKYAKLLKSFWLPGKMLTIRIIMKNMFQ